MNQEELILTLLSIKRWGKKKTLDFVKDCSFNFKECVENLPKILNKEEQLEFKNNYLKIKNDINSNLVKGIKIITIFDKNFPKKLYQFKDPCIYLYYFGNINLLSSKCITIIGTRHPSNEFVDKGRIASDYFARKGYTIVSGLAIGCDTIGHKSAIKNGGNTIAVLPSDLIKIMPVENYELAINIAKNGLLISEYGIEHKFNVFDYAQRDRIQSLLSSVVLVIQSSNNGGTMICVKKSLNDNKKVFALKGNDLSLIDNYVDCDNYIDLQRVESYIS